MHDYIIGFLNGVTVVFSGMTVYFLIKAMRYRRETKELWHLAERE